MERLKKILFVSGFLPSHRVPSGGQKLVYRILNELTATHEVTLLAFCNEKELPYLDASDFKSCAQVKIFTIKEVSRAYFAMRYPHLPMIACARYGMAADWLRQALGQKTYDLAWFEFIQSASLLSLLPPGLPSRLVVHDLFFQAHERKAAQAKGLAKRFWQWEAVRTKRWESKAILAAKEVCTLTDKDRQVAQEITGRRDIGLRYPEVDHFYHEIGRSRGPEIVRGKILFWGHMSRRENEDAVIWFVREILPLIRSHRPHGKLVIAGANPSAAVLHLADDKVEVTGFVADPISLFTSTEIAIAPLRLGAGIKIKVAEYLAAKVPTVATTVGAEGIRSSPLLHTADDAVGFSQACIALMAPSSHA
jgi:glycosyltransferase involved in cell wall biosynthesis